MVIKIYPDAVKPMPGNPEGYKEWTAWDVLNWVGVILSSPNNDDRIKRSLGADLDAVLGSVYSQPWPLGSVTLAPKTAIVEFVVARLPPQATWTLDVLKGLYDLLQYNPPSLTALFAREFKKNVKKTYKQVKDELTPESPTLAAGSVGLLAGVGLVLWGLSKAGRL